MTNSLSTQDIVRALDHKNSGDVSKHWYRLRETHRVSDMVDQMIEAFPLIKNAWGRNLILFDLIHFAQKDDRVIDLAITALHDRAYMPRYQACSILAFSLRKDALPHLNEFRDHKHQKTRVDIRAAIDAIEEQNQNLFVDRDRQGFGWIVGKEQLLADIERIQNG